MTDMGPSEFTIKRSLKLILFETETEEESILTLTDLFCANGYSVVLFVSELVYQRINSRLQKSIATVNIVSSNKGEALISLRRYAGCNQYDLIIFTRFSAGSYSNYKLFKEFLQDHRVCTLIESYERWIRLFPPIYFNGWKVIQRSRMLDWLYNKLLIDKFHSYFVSEPHVDSKNPLKQYLLKKKNKPVFDFPFKIMEGKYKPRVHQAAPIFVVPGSIDKNRRDYKLLLDVFTNKSIKPLRWKLVMLGRPIGKYGANIINRCEKINKSLNDIKIITFKEWVSIETYTKHMKESDYVIAPVIPKKYKMGKDSGAIYDILLFNKLGIVNKGYYYNIDLIENSFTFCYKNKKEFLEIINNIFADNLPRLHDSIIENVNNNFNYEEYRNSVRRHLECNFC